MKNDTVLIRQLVQEINAYLDQQQTLQFLWVELDDHMRTSCVAEHLGDTEVASRHLRAARQLLGEICRWH